jgi:hypothetical protein
MSREELKAAVLEAYQKGYHEGFADACDTIMPALTEATIDTVVKLREAAQEAKAEAVDELEEEE